MGVLLFCVYIYTVCVDDKTFMNKKKMQSIKMCYHNIDALDNISRYSILQEAYLKKGAKGCDPSLFYAKMCTC